MKWEELKKQKAEELMSQWSDYPEFETNPKDNELRNKFVTAFEETLRELDISKDQIGKHSYKFDLEYGLKIYKILENYSSFNLRTASNNNVWRYLSMIVVPDVVFYRWGMKEGRFWKDPRRLWLKAIWWYIYLSWQGDLYSTREVLKDNTTDDIVQLVERAGSLGYRVNLTREIIKNYGGLSKEQKSNQIFRKVMKLNTARVKTVEPELHPEGQETYVKELFEYFDYAREAVKSS